MTSILKVDQIQKQNGTAFAVSDIGGVSSTDLPSGTVIQTVLFPVITRVTVSPSFYSNNKSNFVSLGSAYNTSITLKTSNPILKFGGTILCGSSGGSHNYIDMFVSGATSGWLSEKIASGMDALVSNHQYGIESIEPMTVNHMWQTSVSSGSTLSFEPYLGAWGNYTIRTNQYRDGNSNQDMVTTFYVQEIAG
jgi:hypothetical protein